MMLIIITISMLTKLRNLYPKLIDPKQNKEFLRRFCPPDSFCFELFDFHNEIVVELPYLHGYNSLQKATTPKQHLSQFVLKRIISS